MVARDAPARSGRPSLASTLLLGGLLIVALAACVPLGRPLPPATPVSSPGPGESAALDRAVPPLGHIFVIVMENREYDQVIGSPDAPYINHLAATFALATRYYAIRHPSLPNYLALISGSTRGITDDCATCTVAAPNLVDQLEAQHRTWTAYMEDLPRPCFQGTQAGGGLPLIQENGYVRRHDPFIYFDDIRTSPERCRRIVPWDEFAGDLARGRIADFVWISPNLGHDMHSASTREGDTWLATFVPLILRSTAWKDHGALFIVWDEGTTAAGCCGNAAGGRVPALVIAADGRRGYRSDLVHTHYSLLRTIEDAWGLGYLAHAGDPETTPLGEFFQRVASPRG